MIDEDDGGSSLGGASAILGQFGLGGVSGGKYNLDKIVELARSRRIIQRVLLDSVNIENKTDLFANHLIDIYDHHDSWEEDTMLQAFYFMEDTIAKTDRKANKAIKLLQAQLVGSPDEGIEGIIELTYGEDTNVFTLNCASRSEEFSISLATAIYNELSQFYIKETIEKPRQNFNIIKNRADSVLLELNATEQSLAYIGDRSGGVLMRRDRVKQDRLSRNVRILTLMYGEILKNKETSEFLLKTKTPFFQIIDEPTAPIDPNTPSIIKAIIIGGVLGGFLTVFFFFVKKLFRDVLYG